MAPFVDIGVRVFDMRMLLCISLYVIECKPLHGFLEFSRAHLSVLSVFLI